MKHFTLATALISVLLTGCATMDTDDSDNFRGERDFGDAAASPLEDLNVRQTEIPVELETMKNPYFPAADESCTGLRLEISRYDEMLGLDFGPKGEDRSGDSTMAASATSAGLAAVIPFRGLIRFASGANKYEERVELAYRKGVSRRAYLRGKAAEKKCPMSDQMPNPTQLPLQ